MRFCKYPRTEHSAGVVYIYFSSTEIALIQKKFGADAKLVLTEINKNRDVLLLKSDTRGCRIGKTIYNGKERRLSFSEMGLEDLYRDIPVMEITKIPQYRVVDEGLLITIPTEFKAPRKLKRAIGHRQERRPDEPALFGPQEATELSLESAVAFLETELSTMTNPTVSYVDGRLVIEVERVTVEKIRITG